VIVHSRREIVARDVAAGDREQRSPSVVTPLREVAKIEGVGVAGQAGVAAEEACECSQFGFGEHVISHDAHRRGMSHGGSFQDGPEPRHRSPDEAILDQANPKP
jgi:hypothetical protein